MVVVTFDAVAVFSQPRRGLHNMITTGVVTSQPAAVFSQPRQLPSCFEDFGASYIRKAVSLLLLSETSRQQHLSPMVR